ncbi:M1 family metallopeptidase [Phenylobacterium montanum]|uniref:Aminopeptidase n=1 Tax=Phenylobacterium montanum TaxID=2823693 RepID=A0A975FX00_9CAUL|nr:M1 family metallopeptidase [Caulobacter sp. S6]QUD86482.1 M1 family metallopeptidase [Caulobacter sp. S6]
MSISRAARALAFFLALAAGLPAAAQAPAAASQRIVLPADVTPDHYDLDITPDASALTFKGKVQIDLTVHAATREIVLNAADLVIDHAALSGEAGQPSIRYDEKVQTASFGFSHPLKPGHYALSLDYHGRIFQQASGLFALDYQAGGASKRALFTQFENSDARRFLPCWDEPGRKASFTVTATVPKDQMAVSNMPVAEAKAVDDKLQTVRFAETPKMSSYLLFFGLGDFERIHRNVGGVDVGVIVKRGDTANAGFALDAAAEILPYYNDYFGKAFPLPKLDLIAGPGSSQFFGAMENWGAIFYFERDLLIDPKVSTEQDLQGVYVTVAHEMAHQWFGDLVTMAWWNDLWLNEGFASWMENKVTDHFHPNWKLWLQAKSGTESAMQTDARDGSHPIITPINDVLQAGGAFDEITYEKGAAVIRMMEAYVGESAFRDGVRRYMADHAYGNTVTDDLWREIDQGGGPRPITEIAHDFTLHAGVPLLRQGEASCQAGKTSQALAQGRYGIDDSTRGERVWHVPVIARTLDSAAPGHGVIAGTAGGRIEVPGCGPVVLNAGQTGYFRTLYSPAGVAALTQRFSELSADDQLGLLDDTRALGFGGLEPITDYLNLTVRLDSRSDPVVWARLAHTLNGLDRLYAGTPGQARFRSFARGVLARGLARIGWDRQPDESFNVAIMRSAVIGALGDMGDPAVTAEAHRRFDQFLYDPTSLDASARRTVLAIVGRQASAADWERLHQLAKTAKSELERTEYYSLLGAADDPALAAKALDLALSGEPPATTAPDIIGAVSDRHPGLALDFTSAHWAKVSELLEPDSRPSFAPHLVTGEPDRGLADRLNAFADRNIPEDARQEVRKAVSSILYQAQVRDARLPEVDRWIATGR